MFAKAYVFFKEGAEGKVLYGARNYLTKCPLQRIVLELNENWLKEMGTPKEDIVKYMESLGYRINEDSHIHEDTLFEYQK